MNNKTLYETKTPTLADVIDGIGGGAKGATYLIPDLQRGFVWNPQKIEALLDTVIKGWPFGSVLLAEIGTQALAFSPRSLYGRVYCGNNQTEGGTWNVTLNRSSQKSSSYKLILDGQQRLQSLLICLGAEVNIQGIVMQECDWLVYNGNKHKRKPKDYCPACYLAVDIGNLTNQLEANGFDVCRLNFSSQGVSPIFTWVATEKPVHYSNWHWENELPWIQEDFKIDGRITIRLSQLWECAKDSLIEAPYAGFNDSVRDVFLDYGIDQPNQREAVKTFVERLGFIRKLPVNCLCLMSPGTDTPDDEYNEMILNVFTRLNAGGVSLSKEDITLSWVKRNWRQSPSTKEKGAEECMKALQTALHCFGLDLEINELMTVLTGVWACIENRGHLITNDDLMDEKQLKSIAVWLSLNWETISDAIQSVAKSLKDRGLKYKVHFGSPRVLILLSTWNLVGRMWFQKKGIGARVNAETGFIDVLFGGLSDRLDRLVFSGVWTGDWASQSRMTSIAQMNERIQDVQSIDEAKSCLVDYLNNQISEMSKKAISVVKDMAIKPRNGVSAYKSFLWVWQRLNESRAKYSTILARARNGWQEGIPHVDHCLSWHYWESSILPKFKVEEWSQQYKELSNCVNQIGNCTILMGSLNISKSDRAGTELERFLCETVGKEIGKEQEEVENCLRALEIDRVLVNPDKAESLDQLCKTMNERTNLIKEELVEFLRGSKKRVLDANA